jgi:UDP-2,3-diacylglucosamine hydrolase
MKDKAVFISDIHLGVQGEGQVADRETKLVQLLNSLQGNTKTLVLVGDVFEFWMEYHWYVPKQHFKVLSALYQLSQSGTDLHYIAGNHDFYLGEFFDKELNIKTHQSLMLNIQGKRVFFKHGDGLAESDWAYRLARRVITHPVNLFLFRLLHPDWGMALARFVGGKSRKANYAVRCPVEEYQRAAQAIILEQGCDIFVQGHTHDSTVVDLESGQWIKCGQWITELSYMEMEDGICKSRHLE